MGKGPRKSRSITDDLRQWIVSGEFAPGARLPSSRELAQRFHACSATIQAACHRLKREGFIEAHQWHGTFVAAHPPHLCRFGLVLPQAPIYNTWYYQALEREAGQTTCPHCSWRCYRCCQRGYQSSADERPQLQSDLGCGRLAGVAFIGRVENWLTAEERAALPVPYTAVQTTEEGLPVPHLHLGYPQLVEKGLAWLAANGRRRVALVGPYTILTHLAPFLDAGLAHHRLHSEPFWRLGVTLEQGAWARSLVRLLLQPDRARWPDGLFVLDDNLLPHASAGVVESACRVPADLAVISHCNFPYQSESAVPTKRVGFAMGDLLRACGRLLTAQRQGGTTAHEVALPALFDHELTPAPDAAGDARA